MLISSTKKPKRIQTSIIDIKYTITSKEPNEYIPKENTTLHCSLNSYTTNNTITSLSSRRKIKTIKLTQRHHPCISFIKNTQTKSSSAQIVMFKATNQPKKQILLSSITKDFNPKPIERFNKGIGLIQRDSINCDPWVGCGKSVRSKLAINKQLLHKMESNRKPIVPILTIQYRQNKSNISTEFDNLNKITLLFNTQFQNIRNTINNTMI